MTDSPLVSVYLPTRNRQKLLERAVDSVLSQDYRNLELIVVDDGSTDGTAAYLASKASVDPRLKFRVNERSLGACSSRNIAIGMAAGEFITGLDDDDYLLPSHLSSLLAFWPRRRKDVVAVFPDVRVVDKDGNLLRFRRGKWSRAVERRHNLLPANRVGGHLFLRTEDLRATGGFDPAFPAWQDLECWYRLLQGGSAAQCSRARTYVVDVGHDLERITTAGADRIKAAYDNFVAKHPLTWLEARLLHANYRSCVIRFRPYTPVMTFVWRAYHYAIRIAF